MRAEYKRDMNHNYLILHGEWEIDTASYQVRMLVGNVIPSLLKCRIQGMDGNFMVYYDITSRQSLSAFYENRKLRQEDLKLIFGAFVRVMEDTAEYLMNPGQLVISPDLIFLEVEKKEVYFCLMPGYQKEVKEQLQTLTEYILPKIDHEDNRAVMLGYGVYRRALEDSFHLEHIKEELYRGRTEENGKFPEKKQEYEIDERNSETNQDEKPDSLWKDETLRGSFVREDGDGSHDRDSKGKRIGKAILGSFLFVAAAGSAMAAKMLGYLPYIGMEVILGSMIAGLGAGMLIYLAVNRKKAHADASAKQKRDSRHKKTISEKPASKRLAAERSAFERSAAEEPVSERIVQERAAPERMMSERVMPERLSSPWDVSETIMPEKTEKRQRREESFGETVVLSANPITGPASLVSYEPGELAAIYLKEDITVIGKLETACDAAIDLPTVSRIHAKIRKRDNEYYLTDLNSRNGTSVNGRLLKPEEEYKLEDEDQVDFAQARYIFLK